MRKINLENEKNFENNKIVDSSIREKQLKYYWAVQPLIDQHNANTLAIIKNKKVLEIGCSSGELAEIYCQHSKSYIGIDISDRAIDEAKKKKLFNADFKCLDCHDLPFDNGRFDCIIVNSILHHLNLELALREMHRVLNIQGILILREPLGINPLWQVYRFVTPHQRTADEKAFSLQDIKVLEKFFDLTEIKWFGLLSLASGFIRLKWIRSLLNIWDTKLTKLPYFKYLCWQIAGIGKKRKKFLNG
jgi:SAM-dependent methyltransferase